MEKKKVIIADDEMYICKLIESLIEWDAYGMEVIAFASNGNEAYSLCRACKADILITDIRMPGLNGLDLIKKINEDISETKIIIITGYSQFQYALQAIKYNVVDYLLKPVQKEDLVNALMKSADIIEKEQKRSWEYSDFSLKSMQKIKDNILTVILNDQERSMNLEKRKQLFEKYYLQFKGKAWQLIQVEFIMRSDSNIPVVQEFLETKIKDIIMEVLKLDNIEIDIAFLQNSFFALLQSDKSTLKQIHNLISDLRNKLLLLKEIIPEINFTIGISRIHEDCYEIYNGVDECQECIISKVFKGTNKIIRVEDLPAISGEKENCSYFINDSFRKNFLLNITNVNLDELSVQLDDLITVLYRYSGKISGKIIRDIYYNLIDLFYQGTKVFNLDETDEFSRENLMNNIHYFYSIMGMFTYLKDVFKMLLKKCQENKENQNTRPIRNAQAYIEENYIQPITLEEIAKYVGLNEAYLSSIFKKQVGKSLIDYLTYVRIQHAKELLIDRDKSINEIAENVGFNDAKYFTKRFKKFTGISPNEYRKLFS